MSSNRIYISKSRSSAKFLSVVKLILYHCCVFGKISKCMQLVMGGRIIDCKMSFERKTGITTVPWPYLHRSHYLRICRGFSNAITYLIESLTTLTFFHDDVIKWKRFPLYWPLVGLHWSPVISRHKGQWRGALILSLICAWIKSWINDRDAGDLRRHPAHYGDVVMMQRSFATTRCVYCTSQKVMPTIHGLSWVGAAWFHSTCIGEYIIAAGAVKQPWRIWVYRLHDFTYIHWG